MAINNLGLDIQIGNSIILGGEGLRSYTDELTSYSHVLGADWGFVSADIQLADDLNSMYDWLTNGLGRHVVVKNQGGEVRFAGFVDSVALDAGNVSYRVGPLTEIGNRVLATYTALLLLSNFVSNTGQTETTFAEDADSQTRFGIWEKIIQAGQCYVEPSSSYNEAEDARDTFLVTYRDPNVVINTVGGTEGESLSVNLSVRGYQDWLSAFYYQNRIYAGAVVGSATVTAKIQAALGDDPNGIFSADYSQMDANPSLQALFEEDYQTALAVVESCAKVGDGTSRWVFQIDADRRAVFRALSTDPVYIFSLSSNQQQFRNKQTDAAIDPWNVDPGYYYEMVDTPLGFVESGFNPNIGFIEEVRFDAPYSVSVSGEKLNRFKAYMDWKAGGSY